MGPGQVNELGDICIYLLYLCVFTILQEPKYLVKQALAKYNVVSDQT